MPRRNVPIDPDITRKDIKDAIDTLSQNVLDPDNPLSLYSTVTRRFDEHEKKMDEVVNRVHTFIEDEYRPFKTDYEKTKNRGLGYLAGAGAAGGGIFAVIKHFFLK